VKSYSIQKDEIDQLREILSVVMQKRAVCEYLINMDERTITVNQLKDGVLHNAITMMTLNMLNLWVDIRYIKCEENKWVIQFEYYNRN